MHSIFIHILQGRSQIALKFTLWFDGSSSALMEKETRVNSSIVLSVLRTLKTYHGPWLIPGH